MPCSQFFVFEVFAHVPQHPDKVIHSISTSSLHQFDGLPPFLVSSFASRSLPWWSNRCSGRKQNKKKARLVEDKTRLSRCLLSRSKKNVVCRLIFTGIKFGKFSLWRFPFPLSPCEPEVLICGGPAIKISGELLFRPRLVFCWHGAMFSVCIG